MQISMVVVFLAGAIATGWVAHEIHYNGRIDLIRLGSEALPGASLLKARFTYLVAFQAVSCLMSAALVAFTGAIFPAFLLFLCTFVAVATRRGMLVKALELHSQAGRSEA